MTTTKKPKSKKYLFRPKEFKSINNLLPEHQEKKKKYVKFIVHPHFYRWHMARLLKKNLISTECVKKPGSYYNNI